MNRIYQTHSGRKQWLFAIILLLLSACFFSCQFTPWLELDSSTEASFESNEPTSKGSSSDQPSVSPSAGESETLPPPINNETSSKYYNALTGLPTDKNAASARPIAVCIGNTAASLPQYGLSLADILIEAPVEGGSTRLMAITQNYRAVACYGSIRSTREYLQLLAKNFDAISVFAGTEDTSEKQYYQCGESLDYIAQNLTTTFYRDTVRQSPHNLMTSGELLSFAVDDSGYRTDGAFTLPYKIAMSASDSVTARNLAASNVELPFSSLQKVKFTYNASTNAYYRFQNGAAHMDAAANTQLKYTNLILLFCDSVTQATSSGEPTLSMTLSGSGSAYYISGGMASEIAWRKDASSSTLAFYDANGKQLTLTVGNTYIGLLKSSSIESIVIK